MRLRGFLSRKQGNIMAIKRKAGLFEPHGKESLHNTRSWIKAQGVPRVGVSSGDAAAIVVILDSKEL
jgi:hypothetical protein